TQGHIAGLGGAADRTVPRGPARGGREQRLPRLVHVRRAVLLGDLRGPLRRAEATGDATRQVCGQMTDTTEHNTEPARIRVRGLEKSFGERQVLRGLDFESRRGTSTVLLGPSGSGKTTVLRSLNALDIPERGIVGIDDVEIDFARLPRGRAGRREASRLRAQSGMVFQSHNLFP